MKVKEQRPYELGAPHYALVQDVRNRLGALAAAEVECILGGSIRRFYNTPESQVAIIRSLAKVRGVTLPE